MAAGASFTEALHKHPRVFGDFYVNMVEAGEAGGALDTILIRLAVYEVGESAGALDAMLNKIADFCDDEVSRAVEALTSLLEPLLMVVLGALLGFMLIAMYLPIFEMAGTLG